jgi:hypothetical protein
MPQFGAYLTIVIYDRKTFIVHATGERYLCLIVVIKRLGKMPSNEPMELRTLDTYERK